MVMQGNAFPWGDPGVGALARAKQRQLMDQELAMNQMRIDQSRQELARQQAQDSLLGEILGAGGAGPGAGGNKPNGFFGRLFNMGQPAPDPAAQRESAIRDIFARRQQQRENPRGLLGAIFNPAPPVTDLERGYAGSLMGDIFARPMSPLDQARYDKTRAETYNLLNPSPYEEAFKQARLENLRAETASFQSQQPKAEDAFKSPNVEPSKNPGVRYDEWFDDAINMNEQPRETRVTRWGPIPNDDIFGADAYRNIRDYVVTQAVNAGVPPQEAIRQFQQIWNQRYQKEAGQSFQEYADPASIYRPTQQGFYEPANATEALDMLERKIDPAKINMRPEIAEQVRTYLRGR
jgi:hypothetical protein